MSWLVSAIGIVPLVLMSAATASAACPSNSEPYAETTQGHVRTIHCRCKTGYQQQGEMCVPADVTDRTRALPSTPPSPPSDEVNVPLLSKDPVAARLSEAQLKLVDARIVNLQKAIQLLSASNPEWEKSREALLEHWHEDLRHVGWEATNLVTLGLTEWLKAFTVTQLADMKSDALARLFKEPLAHLPAEEARLKRVLASSADPALTSAIVRYLAALHRVEAAREQNNAAEMIARARDAGEALRDEFEVVNNVRPKGRDIYEALYASSAVIGRFAMVFAKGAAAEAVAIGSAASSVVVGGRALTNVWEDHKILTALDQDTSRRIEKRHELMARLSDAKEERERLVWATERAR